MEVVQRKMHVSGKVTAMRWYVPRLSSQASLARTLPLCLVVVVIVVVVVVGC